jgi:hypothetical protein
MHGRERRVPWVPGEEVVS